MHYFCIRFVPEIDPLDTPCSWAVLDERGNVVSEGSHLLSEVRDHVDFRTEGSLRVVVLVPGDRVLTVSVEVEPQHLAHIKQVIPHLVEDQLAEDLDDVHIALPAKIGVGHNDVAVVSHTELIHWLDLLYSVDLKAHILAPEFLFLPETGADLRALFEGDRVLLQFSNDGGTVVEPHNLAAYITIHKATHNDFLGDAFTVDLFSCQGDNKGNQHLKEQAASLAAQKDLKVSSRLYNESPFSILAMTAVRKQHRLLNLLQGGYKVAEPSGRRFPWRSLAAGLALFMMTELSLLLGSGLWFESKAGQLQLDAEHKYREIFPNEKRVVNARRQFESHLKRASGSGHSQEFMYLLQAAAELIPTEVDGVSKASIELTNIRYDAFGDGMLMEVGASTIDDLERYTADLAARPLNVELLSAIERDNAVVGRIRLGVI